MKRTFCFWLFLLFAAPVFSQNVGVGTVSPDPSAKLEVSSTTQGILFPRVTTAQRNGIASPALGLMVFDVEKNVPYYFNGVRWIPLGPINPKDVPPVEVSSNLSSSASFGYSVGITDGYAAVGCTGFDSSGVTNIGAVFIYKKTNGVWSVRQTLVAPDTTNNDQFGYSLDMDGDYLVVGVPYKDVLATSSSGKAYVYKLNRNTGLYELDGQLTHPNGLLASSLFGWSVGITAKSAAAGGVAVVVGSPSYQVVGSVKGTASVFRRNGANNYTAMNTINGYQTSELFGLSVSIDSNLVAIGAPGYDSVISANTVQDIGRVQINRYSGSNYATNDAVLRPGSDTGAMYGYSVAIDSANLMVAGDFGGTTLISYPKNYVRTGVGTYSIYNSYTNLITDYEGGASSRIMGYRVAITRNFAIIGVPHYNVLPSTFSLTSSLEEYGLLMKRRSGTGYFDLYNQLTRPEHSLGSHIGFSVACYGKDYIIGVIGSRDYLGNYGSVDFGTIEE